MTNQEKKGWLNRYREAEAEAVRLEQEMETLYSTAERMTVSIGQLPRGSGGGRSLETAVAALDALATQCGRQRLEALRIRREIEDAIAAVAEGRLRILLRHRYLSGMKWERIAENMGFDKRHVTRLHGDALTAIREYCP